MNTDEMKSFFIDGHKATYKEAQLLIKSKLEKDGALETFIDDNWRSVRVMGREYKASEVAAAMEGRKKLLDTTIDYVMAHPERMGITASVNIRPRKTETFNQNNRMGKKWQRNSNMKERRR